MSARVPERVILGITALIVVIIGLGGLIAPSVFYVSYEIRVTGENLSNELRAVGAALTLLGLAVAAGAIWRDWSFSAALIGALVGIGFAVGRVVSLLVDGIPVASIVGAGAVEAVFGVACAWVAVRRRPRE
ncbi:DUF4345 domain-containing protein [Microbacterium sp. AGC85]